MFLASLELLSLQNLRTGFLLGGGEAVTPCVMVTLINFLKLQLGPNARANQVTKVEIKFKGKDWKNSNC
jgi:hypothetical protein